MNELEALGARLRAAGFRGTFETDASASVVYGTDNSIYQLRPVGAAVPTSARDLSILAEVNHGLDRPFDLVARGGGTGTNGQSLTNGLIVDTRRAMNRIVSIDPDAREAVVQPGVVLGQLNAALKPHGLFFAPHVSTASRATIGGMVATDAAGKGSLVYGRTNQHVLGIDAVLADGTPCTFGPLDANGMTAMSARSDRIGKLHRSVREATAGLPADAFPEIPRGFTGYNLADAAAGGEGVAGGEGDAGGAGVAGKADGEAVGAGGVDVTKLLCGSEGTLALIAEIRIRLTPLASDPRLAVIAYRSFEDAVRDSNRLKAAQPIAIECLDDRTISLASASPAWPRLAAMLDEGGSFTGGSLLLMEFDGADGIASLHDLLAEHSGSVALAATADPADIAAVWKVRADAVGLLGQSVGGRRSVAFVEDCAVPPMRLEEFVAEYRAALDRHGLTYGMFGHADVGCIHVRPVLDLYDPAHEALLRTISDEVAALVARFGGVLWGEHGRGFRGEYLDLDEDIIRRMRMIKAAFDPNNLLNPGKLYSPIEAGASPRDADGPNDILRIDEVPLRVHRDRSVAAAQRDEFESAFGCNGNGICHHWGEAEVMCPSYKVTLDPRLSPKGRADLLRAWLDTPDDDVLADEVADSLRQCLSCGACTGRCPVGVDIPEMKSRFFEQRPETSRRRRLRHVVMSRFETMLPRMQGGAGVLGPLQRIAAPLLARTLGIIDLPSLPSGTLRQRMAAHGVAMVGAENTEDVGIGDATVVIVPDAFTAFIDPDVLDATIDVLRAIGERPMIAPFVPSGKLDHVAGRRRRFARAVAAQRTMIESLSTYGLELVVIEPAVSLLGEHEYRSLDSEFPAEAVTSLAEFMAPRIDRLAALGLDGRGVAQLFGHCTEVSLAPDRSATYAAMLEAVGFDVQHEVTTCCGMAGIFGHEAENQAMSAQLFDLGWRDRLSAPGVEHRCASGYSCRSQAKRCGHDGVLHPIQVVAAALR